MLERTAATIEPCSLQRVLPTSRTCLRSRRKLHTAFWHHGAADLEVFDACPVLLRQSPAEPKTYTVAIPPEQGKRFDAMTTSSAFLLDFLYPRGTAAFLRRPYPVLPGRIDPSSSNRRATMRSFTSAPGQTENSPDGQGQVTTDGQQSTQEKEQETAGDGTEAQAAVESRTEDDLEQLFQVGSDKAAEDITEPTSHTQEPNSYVSPELLQKQLMQLQHVAKSEREAAYEQLYQTYMRLDPNIQPQFTTEVLLAISESIRPLDAERICQLFQTCQVSQWTEELVRAAVKSQLLLHKATDAVSIYKTALEERGFGGALDYIATYGLELSMWDMILEAWELYSAVQHKMLHPSLQGSESGSVKQSVEQDARLSEQKDQLNDVGVVPGPDTLEDGVRSEFPSPDASAANQDVASAVESPSPETSTVQDVVTAVQRSNNQPFISTIGYATLATISDFEIKVRKMYQYFERNPSTLHQRTAMLDSFLGHVLRYSMDLFGPSDAVFMLGRAKDPELYELYIIRSAEQERKRLASDLYRKYRQLPQTRVSDAVLRVMIDIFNPHDVRGMELILEDWYRFYGQPEEKAYHKLMAFYAGRGDATTVTRLAEEYGRHYHCEIEKEPKIVTNIMHAHAVRGDVEATRQVMEENTKKSGLEPDIMQWNVLLNAYTKAGDYGGAIELFAQICEEHEPDDYTFGTLMKMAGFRGDLQFTLELFQMARERNIQPTVAMMASLIEAYCQNDRYSEAEQLCISLTRRREISGDYTYLWNALLQHNAKRRDLAAVNRVLENMSSEGIAYNHETYNQLLLALLYCRQSHHAMHLLRAAQREGAFEPTADHFILLMSAFINSGEPHLALKTNELMASMNYPESAFRLTKVIDALGRWQELPKHQQRGADGQAILKKILREFYKAMEREDKGASDTVRSTIGLYSKVLFILTQMREFATVQQIIQLHNTRYPGRSTPETLPLRLLHNIMLADFYEKKYDRVKETWELVFRRAIKRYSPAATLRKPKEEQESNPEPVIYAQRFRLCDPLKTMQRLYLELGDAEGLLKLISRVRAAGFDLDSKNWNYHVQVLARLKRWREAFTVCEKVLMPNWTGWQMVRVFEHAKAQLPLDLRRMGRNPYRPRPITHTLLILAKEYMDLERMMLWSRQAAREFEHINHACPKTVQAVTSMVRTGSELEEKIFSSPGWTPPEQLGEWDEGKEETWEELKARETAEEKRANRLAQKMKRPGSLNGPKAERKRGKKHEGAQKLSDAWTEDGFLNVEGSVLEKNEMLDEEGIVAAIKEKDGSGFWKPTDHIV